MGIAKDHIVNGNGSRCLHNRNGSGDDTGIVTTLYGQLRAFSLAERNAVLGAGDGRCSFEGGGENHRHTVGDTTQDTAGRRSVSDEDIKFALFGGDGEITDAMYQEVKDFAALVKLREEMRRTKE